MSHCLASARIPGLVDLQRIQTLQKFVQNRDDTDKESVSKRCGHCGAFVLAQTHKTTSILMGLVHKDGWTKPLRRMQRD